MTLLQLVIRCGPSSERYDSGMQLPAAEASLGGWQVKSASSIPRAGQRVLAEGNLARFLPYPPYLQILPACIGSWAALPAGKLMGLDYLV